jgi:hypothetical protein
MKGTASFVAGRVKDNSIFAVLHRECHVLFADELFADLSAPRGALTYPLPSREGLEVMSLGPVAYLASKEKGDKSMPPNQALVPRRWGEEPEEPA